MDKILDNKKDLINNFLIKSVFKTALLSKEIIPCKFNINVLNDIIILSIDSFYRTAKIIKYKRLCKKKNLLLKNTKKLLKNVFLVKRKLNVKSICLKLIPINQLINKKKLAVYFLTFKKFNSVLFSRSFNLFIDFLKMTLLLGENKITPKTYLIILAQIFRNLTKKKHTRFIFCFKFVFNYLLLFSEIKGIKFVVNGKLLGKTRASTVKIEKGSISINTKSVNLMFGKIEVHTLYGVFGFKLWLNYK